MRKTPQMTPERLKLLKDGRRYGLQNAIPVSSVSNLTTLQKQTMKRVSEYLPSALRTFYRAYSGGKAAAIKAKCIECAALQKIEVTKCAVEGCPLWAVRPYRDRVLKQDENED